MDLEELSRLINDQDDSALWHLDEAWRAAQELRSTDPRSAVEQLAQLAPLWAQVYAQSGSMQWYADQLALLDATIADLEHPGDALTEMQAGAHLIAVEWVTWVEGLSAVALVNAMQAADDFDQRFGGTDQPIAVRRMWARSRFVRALVLGAVENAQAKIAALDLLVAQLSSESDEGLLDLAKSARGMATSEMLDVDPVEAERRLASMIDADPELSQDETVWAHRALLTRRWNALTPPDQAGRQAVLAQARSIIDQALGGQRSVMRADQLGGLWSLLLEDAIQRADFAQLQATVKPYLDLAEGAEPEVRQEVLSTAIMWARGIDRAEDGRESEHSLAAWAELGRRFGNDTQPELEPLVGTVWIQWADHEASHDRDHAVTLYQEAINRFGASTHPEIYEPITWTRLNLANELRQLNRFEEATAAAESLAGDISAEDPPPQRRAAVIALRMLGTRLTSTGTPESLEYLRRMLDNFGEDPDTSVREAVTEAISRVWDESTDPAAVAWACEQFRIRFDADVDPRVIRRNNSRINVEATTLLDAGRQDEAVALLASLVERWRESPDPAIMEDVRRAQQRMNLVTDPEDPVYRELAVAFEAAAGHTVGLMRSRGWKKVIKKARTSPDGKTALLAMRAHQRIVQQDTDDQLWTFVERSSRAALEDLELLRGRIEPIAATELTDIHLDLLWMAAVAQEQLNELNKAFALYAQIEQVAGQIFDPTDTAAQFSLNSRLHRARLLVQLGNVPAAMSTYAELIAIEEANQTTYGFHRIALAASEQSDLLAQGGDWRSAASGYRNAFHAALRMQGSAREPMITRTGVRSVEAWARAGDAAAAAAMADQLHSTGIALDHEQHQTVASVLAWARP